MTKKFRLQEDRRGDTGITIEDGVLIDVGMDVEKLIVPSGVHTIDARVCMDHKKLKQVVIPETVKKIGGAAFANDDNITHFALPLSMAETDSELGQLAFWGCCPEFIVAPLYFFDFFKRENVEEAVFIADPEWTWIATLDFNNCRKLKKIFLPDNITEIQPHSFSENCVSLEEINYNNTKAAWHSIKKGENWDISNANKKKLDFVVKCTDGVLAKETR